MLRARSHAQAARTRAQQELQRSKGSLADTLEAITRLENGLADASTKFGFLQEIRAYMADLCDMLQVMAGQDPQACLAACMGDPEIAEQLLSGPVAAFCR